MQSSYCNLLERSRSAWRYMPIPKADEALLETEVILLTSVYDRYGYRMVAGLMRQTGRHQATTARVARIWRREGLKVPQKQAPSGRLRGNEGSCVRLLASYPNHVWSYDFVFERDAYGGKIRMLMIDLT